MKISNWTHLLALIGAIMCLTCASRADDILYQTGFESPGFQAGLPILGQNGWLEYSGGNGPNTTSNGAGLITTNHPASGQQCLQVTCSKLPFLSFAGLYYTDYAPDQRWYFSQHPMVRMEAQIRLDGPSTGSTLADDLISANLLVVDRDAILANMWVSSNGHVHYYSDTDPGPTYDGYLGPAVTLGQYHDLAVILNSGTLTDSFFVNGHYVASLAMPAAAISDDEYAMNLTVVGVPDQPGYDHTQYTAYFDNIKLAAVPEPGATALLVGMVLAGAALRARHRIRSRTCSGNHLMP